MLKDRQTTASTMPKLERTETEIKSFCDRKRNVLMTRVWSAGGDPPTGGRGREGKEGGPKEMGGQRCRPALRRQQTCAQRGWLRCPQVGRVGSHSLFCDCLFFLLSSFL